MKNISIKDTNLQSTYHRTILFELVNFVDGRARSTSYAKFASTTAGKLPGFFKMGEETGGKAVEISRHIFKEALKKLAEE